MASMRSRASPANRLWCDQDAMRFLPSASDPAAKLMKLRQAEAIGVFDHHHRCVRNVHADFDDGCGHQDLNLVAGGTDP